MTKNIMDPNYETRTRINVSHDELINKQRHATLAHQAAMLMLEPPVIRDPIIARFRHKPHSKWGSHIANTEHYDSAEFYDGKVKTKRISEPDYGITKTHRLR